MGTWVIKNRKQLTACGFLKKITRKAQKIDKAGNIKRKK
jgi:hypothetical protein